MVRKIIPHETPLYILNDNYFNIFKITIKTQENLLINSCELLIINFNGGSESFV